MGDGSVPRMLFCIYKFMLMQDFFLMKYSAHTKNVCMQNECTIAIGCHNSGEFEAVQYVHCVCSYIYSHVISRVNCIDCLDRTNVVQTSIARLVLENQLTKLGVSGPEQPLHDETRRVFQM